MVVVITDRWEAVDAVGVGTEQPTAALVAGAEPEGLVAMLGMASQGLRATGPKVEEAGWEHLPAGK